MTNEKVYDIILKMTEQLSEVATKTERIPALERKIEGLKACVSTQITDVKVDVGKLKVKSGIWGALGGIIPASIMTILYLIKK